VLPTRSLGRGGLEVSAVGFGAMVVAPNIYGDVDDQESLATHRHAIDRGMTFLDTADVYGMGHSERLVGEAVRGRRDEVKIATKFGAAGGPSSGGRDNVRRSIDRSLRHLGLEHVDLYYLHRVDPTVPIEETVGAMGELVSEGKVGHIGLSEAAPDTIRRGHATHPLAAVQSEYSLFSRDPEAELLPLLRELGIGFVAYSPLGRGLLTGAIRGAADIPETDWRRQVPRFQGENLDRNVDIVGELGALAALRGLTTAQLALAWLLNQGDDVVPIPGTRRPERIDENAGAASATLSPEDLSAIDAIVAGVAGERGNSAYMSRVNL
jgi:aryl-alcohol dehydrogenase-like predicted oxidoreductase